MSTTTRGRNVVSITYVVHSHEGTTFEVPLSAVEAEARLAKLNADPAITGARIEVRDVKLTAAQRSSIDLVSHGVVSYRPGRDGAIRSRYSYQAEIGGKSRTRTKSVDRLVDLGLADLAGSGSYSCKVILTQAAKDFLCGPNAL